LEGWDRDGYLVPMGGNVSYRGHDELRRYLEKDIHEAPEFDFRIYTILDQGDLALTFGRYSVNEGDVIVEKGVFCISRAKDQRLVSWEAFDNVGDAFREFRSRLEYP